MTAVTAGPALLAGNRKRRAKETRVKLLLGSAAVLSLVVSVLIVGSLLFKAEQFLADLISPPEETLEAAGSDGVGLGSLVGDQWSPRLLEFDIKTLLFGSLVVTFVAMLVAGPVGFGAAIYLSEYANPRVRKILKPILEVLAGIPSVVLGFFALKWIGPNVVDRLFNSGNQSLLAAGLGVGILTIPLVASISEDAMRSVPNALREASAGLGARKMTTSISVVVPAAISGLVAALIVATSRAIGETMVVFLAAGGSGNSAQFTLNPLDKGATMTAAMASQASGTDGTIIDTAFNSLFFVGAVLFIITLSLNLIADRFVRRVRQAY
jgi:phosphate transport system permease protein